MSGFASLHMSTSPTIEDLSHRLPRFSATAAAAARLTGDTRFDTWISSQLQAGIEISPALGPLAGPLYRLFLRCSRGDIELIVSAGDDPGLAIASAPDLTQAQRTLALHALLALPLGRYLPDDGPFAGSQALSLEPVDAAQRIPDAWHSVRDLDRELTRVALGSISPNLADALRVRAPHPQVSRFWRDRMYVPGWVELASVELSLVTMRTLSPGDVVLLPLTAGGLDRAPVRWRSGPSGNRRLHANAAIEGGQLKFTGTLMTHDPKSLANQANSQLPQEQELDALEQLELPIGFEVETSAMSLTDLEAIRPGYVIEFSQPLSAAGLRLVCAGQVIGHAELVAVGDRLGARITRMVASDEHEQRR
ncbi:type III secretion system cytoplasmic ring protein SctQ [Paucibacter sp. PLA-PC-4]|uniref:type III secretion system cytoplasmic ring protein SctQ n=1 Tax=Paucibacter sp. PLA-PC-4 TaxID=2993655 RepID=UPI00224B1143|nr:type III secretion system cytoplasmic ring protein SctQ [Paucibacter sp. PLA-PC-4]MCX2865579.1 type III secretion system cytoplasmic ring protein SctQ [Paucibacter sp. PLA-PC-4]